MDGSLGSLQSVPALVAGDSIVHCPELGVPRDLKQAVSQEDKNPTQRRQYLPEETSHHLWGCSSHREMGRTGLRVTSLEAKHCPEPIPLVSWASPKHHSPFNKY